MTAELFIAPNTGSGSPRVDRTMAAMEWERLLNTYNGDRIKALRHIAEEQEWDTLDTDPLAPYDLNDAVDLLESGHEIAVVLERMRILHCSRLGDDPHYIDD